MAEILKQIRGLRKWPDPALSTPCEPVPQGEDCSQLIDEMWSAMTAAHGIGLAANQLGENKCIIICRDGTWKVTIINPVIIWQSASKLVLGKEGCLSFPDQRVWVPRNRHIKVRGFNRHWVPSIIGGRGLPARILQHETDHLLGINMTQRAVDPYTWVPEAPVPLIDPEKSQ